MVSLRTVRWRLLAITLYFFGFGIAVEKALAQQATTSSCTPSDPMVQALYEKLRLSDQEDVQHMVFIFDLQNQLKAAQDELAKLRASEKPKS